MFEVTVGKRLFEFDTFDELTEFLAEVVFEYGAKTAEISIRFTPKALYA